VKRIANGAEGNASGEHGEDWKKRRTVIKKRKNCKNTGGAPYGKGKQGGFLITYRVDRCSRGEKGGGEGGLGNKLS